MAWRGVVAWRLRRGRSGVVLVVTSRRLVVVASRGVAWSFVGLVA
ncbi:hypothetical protein ACXZ9C_11775 [Streptococcus agalactiae]